MTGPGSPTDGGMPDPPADDAAALAGEYVLGVLDADAEAAVRARLATDPALAAEVDFWRARLARLHVADGDAPAPSMATWLRIERTLSGADAVRSVPPVPGPAPAGRRSGGMFWRAATVAASAAALVLAALLVIGPEDARRPPAAVAASSVPQYVALLQSDSGAPLWLVESHADGSLVLVPLDVPAAGTQEAYELWALPRDDAAPRSLGLVGRRADRRVPAAADAEDGRIAGGAFGGAATLAVSREPAGGSPTGAPTGPVIAVGEVRAVPAAEN